MSATDDVRGAGVVHLRREGVVATLTFDRPTARNAMTWAMYEQFAAHCRTLAADPEVRVAVLRGAGGEAFVAGTDIAQFEAFRHGDGGGEDGVDYERRIDAGIALVELLPMPTVAVVEGWCVGGGLAIATACDFRLATPGSRFAVPIARTLGNTLSVSNLARLERTWGLARVRRMLLLAEVIDARDAVDCGAVIALHGAAELDAAVAALCTRLASLAPVTQAVTKESLRRLGEPPHAQADDLLRRCYGSDDFREGVAAFGARRPPNWRGH